MVAMNTGARSATVVACDAAASPSRPARCASFNSSSLAPAASSVTSGQRPMVTFFCFFVLLSRQNQTNDLVPPGPTSTESPEPSEIE